MPQTNQALQPANVTYAPGPSGTSDQLAAFLTDGYWDSKGSSWHRFGNTITVNLDGLAGDGLQLALWAMEAWEMVAYIDFVIVPGTADITFTEDGSGAYSSYSSSGNTTLDAIVNVSTFWVGNYGPEVDSYSFQTYVHEIGHALGLGHQGDYNGVASFFTDALFANDSWQVSVMSYFAQDENPNTIADFARLVTPMIADIIAIQDLYGAPSGGVTLGRTVYGMNTTLTNYLGQLFDAIVSGTDPSVYYGDPVAFTIYDETGTDTIDLRFDTYDQYVDLNAEGISDVGGLIGNMIIAAGTLIENFRAGSGSDTVIGNHANNVISGNNGDDTVFGGNGDDTLNGNIGNDTLNGNAGEDMIRGHGGNDRMNGGQGDDTIYGGGGTDTIYGSFGNDTIYGGQGADTIYGGDDNDTIFGSAGNDTISGDAGDDILRGGAGEDTFVFTEGNDTITDFQNNIDTIRIDTALLAGVNPATADILDYVAVIGGDTIIDLGGGNTITIDNMTNPNLLTDDVDFF